MKKFLLSVIGVLLMTGITFAQKSQKSDASCSNLYGKNYWNVSVGLNPVTLKTSFLGEDELAGTSTSIGMTGISWGFTTGIRMMKTQPLYLEVGAKFLNAFKTEGAYDGPNGAKSSEMKYRQFALNIPLLATWQVEVVPKVCIAPYLGLNMRYNLSGKTEQEIYEYRQNIHGYWYFAKTDTESTKWFKSSEGNCNRFNVGLSFGVNFTFNKFILGLGYTKDITEFMQNSGMDANIEYFTISAGLRF